MGIGDKIQNKAEELGGKAKAAVGDLTDNERLEAEGRAQEMSGQAKQAGEHVKDAARDVAHDVREGAEDLKRDIDRKF